MTSALHKAARWYASDMGWPVYPKHGIINGECTCHQGAECSHPGKHPRVKGGAWAGTTDIEQIDAWWHKWPESNIGVQTGEAAGLTIVDVDGPDGAAALAEFGELPATCVAKSGRGTHCYFASKGPVRTRTAVRAQLDVLGDGQSITAPPSRHILGIEYAWEIAPWDCAPATAPPWLAELTAQPPDNPPMPPEAASTSDAHISSYIESALDGECDKVAGGGKGGRNHTLNASAFALGQLIGGGSLSEVVARHRLEVAALECGLTQHEARLTIASGIASGKKRPRVVPAGDKPEPQVKRKKPKPAKQKAKPAKDWRDLLIYKPATQTAPERLASNVANVVTILTQSPDWAGVVAHDDFAVRLAVRRKPPWDDLDAPSGMQCAGSHWTDADSARLHAWLERRFNVSFSGDAVQMGLLAAAHRQSWHPVREYLDSVKWDGSKRLDSWLASYVGAHDTLYETLAGRWWLISAVARIFDPGCKADHVLILEGPQGIGKSTALAVLAGDWFSDSPLDIGSKEAMLAMSGRWIIELAELDALSRTAASRAKGFFSSSTDHVRPPYGRHTQERRRQCIFAGSVNPDGGYLSDVTGARRYWPVACDGIDIDALRANRDQLWAEAVHEHRAGSRWWPEGADERALFADIAHDRQQVDVWADKIGDWISNRAMAPTTGEVLYTGLDLAHGRQSSRDQGRVRAVLTGLGYRQVRRRRQNGTRPRVWVREDDKATTDVQVDMPF